MYIRDIAYSLPDRTVDAKTIADWTEGDEKFVAEKIGISERRFLSEEESTSDLAKKAAEALFDKAGDTLKRDDIDFLVVVTQNPDFQLPHTSAVLQGQLELPNVAAFDISLGCSGWVYALAVCKGMMSSLGYKNGLLVTCDPYSKSMSRDDKSTVSVFGDAAAATWLSAEKGFAEVGDFVLGTDGSKYENLIIQNGGAKHPICSIDTENLEQATSGFSESKGLHMSGRDILQFMLEKVPGLVSNCLDRHGLKDEDVDYYLFHQASRYMLVTLARKLSIDIERVPMNMDKIGNTVSSTIPILIADLKQQGRLEERTALASGFGVGLSWGATVLKFKEKK